MCIQSKQRSCLSSSPFIHFQDQFICYISQMDHTKLSLNIEKVLGSSVSKISQLAQASGCLVYPAGNLVIFYSPILDEQITYLTHSSDSISSIVVSPDQNYLAICEFGKHGCASIYDITDLELVKEGSKEIKWVLKGHKSGIDHLAFSPNGKYIVTVSNQDGSIFLWEEGESITKNRMSKTIAKVLFDSKGDLLAIGRGFIKLWPFQQGIAVRKEEADQFIIEGKTLSFGKKFSSQDFVDGVLLQKDEIQRLVLLSSEGLICIFTPGYEKIEKWIDVMMQGSIALELVDSTALCCGDHALIKVVDLQQLAFKGKFPKPPPTSRENLSEEEPLECFENDQFPKCLGARRVGEYIVTLYSNRSMFLWSMQDQGKIQAFRSILSHRAKINCLTILEEVGGGELVFFASASDDHTLRLWHCYGKDSEEPRRSVDVGALLGLKRNVYCKHLTHIIYTHSEFPVTQIKPFSKHSIACIARNELLIYSLDNFSLTLLQNFDEERLISLETFEEIILLATDTNKIKIFTFKDEKLEKVRFLTVDSGIQKILVGHGRLIVNGKGITRIMTLEGDSSITYYKSEKIGIAGNYLLSCEKKALNIYSLVKSKKTTSVPLNHELDHDEFIETVKSNSWLIVIVTSRNRLLLVNFSSTVLYSEELNHVVTDLEVTEHGKVILSTQTGVLIIRNQTTTAKYKQIDQKVKKWFELNDMNWMDGSVWASKNRSHSISGPSAELKKEKSQLDASKKEEKKELKEQDSIRLGNGTWADLSVSLKQPVFQDVNLEYKNEDNKRSVFNPTSICAQINKVYKEVDAIQKKGGEVKKSPLSGKSVLQNPSLLLVQEKNSLLSHSRPKKRIFPSKEKDEEYKPKFTNNLVESIINDSNIKQKEKISTDIIDPMVQTENQSSIDFGLSKDESLPQIASPPKLEYSKQVDPVIFKQQFVQSIKVLMQLPSEMQAHENIVSIVLEHGEQYQRLYKILDKVFGEEQRQIRKQIVLRKVDTIWGQIRKTLEKDV